MAQQKYTDGSGVAEIWANIKNYVTAQLLGKSNTGHTHVKSEITDFPTIPTKTSDLTNDSGFLTSHQDLSGYVPLSGTDALAGSIVPNTDNAYNLGSLNYSFVKIFTQYVHGSSTQKELALFSSSNKSAPWNHGAWLGLYTNDYSGDSVAKAGTFYLQAQGSGNNRCSLIGTPSGTLTWGSKNVAMQEDVVPRSGGAVITNYFLGRSVNTGSLMISGGTSWSNGGSLEAFGSSHSSYAGQVRLQPASSNSNFKVMTLAPDGTWTWNGTACQITSDQRYKQQITEIDDKLLDAWEDVELVQFKYNESVDTKGKSARLHTGYVVQQIDSACKSHGIDISEYGLYCHEEYPEETEEVEVEQKDGTKTKEIKVIKKANEHYSLRYTEALIVECKYLRRCIARLTARIEELEKGNNSK